MVPRIAGEEDGEFRYPSAKPPDACKLQTLTEDEKVALLRKHNELRGRAARGEDGMPKASNMLRMRWDMELEAVAARWALQCIDKHDECRESTRFPVGQNIAWIKPLDLLTMVQNWYNEIMEFYKDNINPFKFKYSAGHYTQMPLTVLLALAMVFSKCWDLLCAVTAT
ncbi:hypothetical protein R5R35_013343 [Gryllus longicercus]|uniref:SCP domain-containing protein n=1 Tax=Gryllus longicercus TaxID=2509291 RepID=A0AAN9Z7E6_9ORTH